MFTDDIAGEMREKTDATDTRNASRDSERRDIHEQPDERPSSIYHQGRLSSRLTSCAGSSSETINTPDPDIENSLAYTCTSSSRRGSLKRTKRHLPPEEPFFMSITTISIGPPMGTPMTFVYIAAD